MLSPLTSTALFTAVTATHAEFAATLVAGQWWMLVSSTNCWFQQVSPTGTITCVANANMLDTDFMTINDGINAAVVYEYDKSANGVTGGRIAWAAGTTAATVAANLKTAINANQPYITVVDNHNGTLTLSSVSRNITLTENVADAGFLVVYGPIATAGAGSMYLPANVPVILDGRIASNVSIIRDSADGKASLTRVLDY